MIFAAYTHLPCIMWQIPPCFVSHDLLECKEKGQHFRLRLKCPQKSSLSDHVLYRKYILEKYIKINTIGVSYTEGPPTVKKSKKLYQRFFTVGCIEWLNPLSTAVVIINVFNSNQKGIVFNAISVLSL